MTIKATYYSSVSAMLGIPSIVWFGYEVGWKAALAAVLFIWANNISLIAHLEEQANPHKQTP